MLPGQRRPTAKFSSHFFPQHLALLSVSTNVMPMGYWTVISKEPFRFLICMGVGNHSLSLIKKYKEAAFHLMPWSEREWIVQAGNSSGRNVNKAEDLGLELLPAEKLTHTQLVAGADAVFEMVVHMELMNISREFIPYIMDVVAVHEHVSPKDRQPIFYLSRDDFGTMGEQWQYKK